MRNHSAGFFFLCALLAMGCSTAEEPHKAEQWKTILQSRLQQKITVAFDEVTLDDALANFRQMAGVPIVVDPAAAGASPEEDAGDINLTLSEVPLSDALPQVLEPLGLQYALRDEAIFIFRRNAYSDTFKTGEALPETQTKTLNAAIKDLSSDDFAVRERADATLLSLGSAVAPYLAKAARVSTDPEAQLRLRRLQEHFTAKPFPDLQADVAMQLEKMDTVVATNFEATHLGEALTFVTAAVEKKTNKPARVELSVDLRNKPIYFAPAVMHAGSLLRWLAFLSDSRIVVEGDHLKFVNRK
jgi:hypothetical protein